MSGPKFVYFDEAVTMNEIDLKELTAWAADHPDPPAWVSPVGPSLYERFKELFL